MKKCILIVLTFFLSWVISELAFSESAQSSHSITYEEIKSLNQEGRDEKAKTLAIKYLKKYPKDPDVQLLLGSIYLKEKSYLAAKKVLQPALKNYPAYLDVRLTLIDVYLSENNFGEAAKLIEEGLKFSPDNPNLLEQKNKIIKDHPVLESHSDITSTPSQESSKNVETNEAGAQEDYITYDKINEEFKKGNFVQVENMSQEYLAKYPWDSDVYFLLGRLYAKQENYHLAKENLNETLRITPTYQDARILLVQLAIKQKDFTGALNVVNQGLRMSPDDLDLLYLKATIFYLDKKYIRAEEALVLILKKNPDNLQAKKMLDDIKNSSKDSKELFALAKTQVKQKNYDLAFQILGQILLHDPFNKEVRLYLINQEIEVKDYEAALNAVNEGLRLMPGDLELEYAKATIYYESKRYRQSAIILKNILRIKPDDIKSKKMFADIADTTPKDAYGPNQLGFFQQLYHVTDDKGVWDYTTLFYSRDTYYGTMTARLNYAGRLQENGTQEEIELYPKLNKYIYLDLLANYADNLSLFPKYSLGGEAYVSIPNFFDISGGEKYNNLSTTYFNTYTGSLAKTFGQFWISFRPYHFEPKAGDDSTLYTLSMRRYFNTADFFVGMTLGAGQSPDLADLQTVDFIVVDNKLAYLNASIPFSNHRTVVNMGVGYDRWTFPNGDVWQLKNASLGVKVRF